MKPFPPKKLRFSSHRRISSNIPFHFIGTRVAMEVRNYLVSWLTDFISYLQDLQPTYRVLYSIYYRLLVSTSWNLMALHLYILVSIGWWFPNLYHGKLVGHHQTSIHLKIWFFGVPGRGNIRSGTCPCATVFRAHSLEPGQQKPGPPDIFHWNPGCFNDVILMSWFMKWSRFHPQNPNSGFKPWNDGL